MDIHIYLRNRDQQQLSVLIVIIEMIKWAVMMYSFGFIVFTELSWVVIFNLCLKDSFPLLYEVSW